MNGVISAMPETISVLVVDDDPDVQLGTRRVLEQAGYSVLTIGDGEEALKLVSEAHPDLILLDWEMPGIEGIDVCRRIKSDESLADIFVVMASGNRQSSDEQVLSLESGADGFILRPLGNRELRARVDAFVRILRLKRSLREKVDALEAKNEELHALYEKLSESQSMLLQSEKMASIGQLAAGVAHEINNPIAFVDSNLGTLGGYSRNLVEYAEACQEAAMATGDNATITLIGTLKAQKDIDYIATDVFKLIAESKEGTRRVKEIVENLKDFAHPGEVELQITDLHRALDSTVNIVWNELKYHCSVTKHYAPDLPKVCCVSSEINQIFMNLLINASHAIDGQGEITIATERVGDDRVRIRISDTGKGIAPENLKRIFEPFFTTKPVGKGTGLGLSIVWGIVSKHQGSIEVDSVPGQGTTFTLTLPINFKATTDNEYCCGRFNPNPCG